MINQNWWNEKQDGTLIDRICESWQKLYKSKIKKLNQDLADCQRQIDQTKQERKNVSSKKKVFPELMDSDWEP